ncbi:MAG: restriction endonuclease, partial [Proteobacteria bacterium]
MAIPDPDKFISPAMRRALYAQQKIAKLAVSPLEKADYVNLLANIYSRQGTLSAAVLRNYKTGISNMFKNKTPFERLMDFSYPGYLQKLAENFPELLEDSQENIELTNYVFLPEPLSKQSKITIYKEIPKVELMLERIYCDHSRIHELHPRQFEELMAELMMRDGWRVDLTKQSRDGGHDLVCLKSMDNMEFKLICECKKNAEHRKIGVGVLRELQTVISDESAHK